MTEFAFEAVAVRKLLPVAAAVLTVWRGCCPQKELQRRGHWDTLGEGEGIDHTEACVFEHMCVGVGVGVDVACLGREKDKKVPAGAGYDSLQLPCRLRGEDEGATVWERGRGLIRALLVTTT